MATSGQSSSGARGGASRHLLTLAVLILFAFGLAVPTIVLFDNGNHKASAGPKGMHLDAQEVRGRELFSQSCYYCHALKASNAIGRTGPDLDILLKSDSKSSRQKLVAEAIKTGFAGAGQMPALLYRGQEAKDVAKFVAAVAGVGIKANSVEPAGYPDIESKSEIARQEEAEKAAKEEAEHSPAIAEGKKIFTQQCGSCHTLKEAGTSGTIGPNLDELKPGLSTVEHQVINGGGPMPAFGKTGLLKPEEIKAVSTYVSTVAGTE